MKKGQTATEYLIILAVVIIIALIVVGVMGGIPGMGGQARSTTSAAYWSTAKIGITSAVASTNSLVLNVRNTNPNTITITGVTVDPGTGTPVDIALAGDVIVPSGQSGSVASGVTYVMPCDQGDPFAYKLVISYTENGADYTFDGGGQTLDGTCAAP